jgi:ubiquinone/menaquinone biosynthesis C-methylase UbiE
MPFKSGFFDLVWNSSTLDNLENPRLALTEMGRVVTPRGLVFAGVPFSSGPLFFQPLISRTALGQWIGKLYSQRDLGRMLRDAGFRVLKTRYYFFGVFIGMLARKV